MKPSNRVTSIALIMLVSTFLILQSNAQLRRPGIVTIKHEDRNKSSLNTEKGAVYLEGMVTQPVVVKVTKTAPAYSNLGGQRWLGNIAANQNAQLLAVSEKAYRIKGKAQQGQIAGWVRKDSVSGLPDGFEEKLVKFHQRYELVKQLIDNKQVALGMTPAEVIASIGPPDSKSSHVDQAGQKASFEYISYARTPQRVVGYDAYGVPVYTTRYVEVESGRVTIEFTNNLVSSISESEGIGFNRGAPNLPLPPVVQLF